jgi:nitrogenase molybdenum-iron protein NifN
MEGFHGAVRAVVDALAECGEATGAVNVLPGFVSPADTRYLMELMEDFGIAAAFLPDLSETLDGPALEDYRKVPAGGTPTECIRCMGGAPATLELGRTLFGTDSAGRLLEQRFAVPLRGLGLPVGLRETDHLVETLEELAGIPLPRRHAMERGRLLDAYVDGHKYLFGQRVAIFGDPDLVVGLTAFAAEIGLHPVMCASGSRSGRLGEAIRALTHDLVAAPVPVHEGLDFFEIAAIVDQLKPDLLIGSGKGFPIARQHGVPLIRVGFPIHDRFGGQRVLHVGYRGAQALLDRLINAVIARKQDESSVGYSYL